MTSVVNKRAFLKLLEEDEEFRYSVAAKIGLLKILEKLDKHDEKFNKILERLDRHEVEIKKIWEKLEQHDRKFNEILEEIKKIWLKLEEHGSRLSRIELELGTLSESFYCKALWDDLREEIIGRGERVVFKKRNMKIDESDIDLFIETDKRVYVIEVKVKPKHEDVGELTAKADVVKKHYPRKEVVSILAGALIGREIEEYAKGRNVKVYTY